MGADDIKKLPGVQGTVNSFKIKPPLSIFNVTLVKSIITMVLAKTLQGKTYNAEDARKWTCQIADEVNTTLKNTVNMPHYKHVVQVSLGQQLGAGCYNMAKCCWDAESDSQTSDVFINSSLFCICTVFGIYLYDDDTS